MGNKQHPEKDVQEAIDYATTQGWKVTNKGHWGSLQCPYNSSECRCGTRCIAGIWNSPKNPGNHAKQLRQVVDGCTVHRDSKVAKPANPAEA